MNIFLESFLDKNIGDDLMIELLVQRYPNSTFFTIGPNEFKDELPYSKWENLFVIDPTFWEEYLDTFDAYVNIGGSVWQDYGENLDWYKIRAETVSRLKAANKPRLMIGNNLGPIKTQSGEDYFISIMQGLSGITFRDQASYKWAQSHLDDGLSILTGDVVLSRDFEPAIPDPNIFGFTIHRDIVNLFENEGYLQNIHAVIEGLVERNPEAVIRLFAFDTGPTQNDSISAQALYDSFLPSIQSKVEIIRYDGNIPDFLNYFSQCQHVFTSHFHGVILALKMNKPFTPFAYLNKTLDFLTDLNYSGKVINYSNFSNLINYVIENIAKNGNTVDLNKYQDIVERSKLNFSLTDKFLLQEGNTTKEVWIDLLEKRIELIKSRSEIANLNQQLSLKKDEVTGTRQQLQLAQDEVTGTRQQLQVAQDEVTGIRYQLQVAQDEITGIRQQLQNANEENASIGQRLTETQQAASDIQQQLELMQVETMTELQQIQSLELQLQSNSRIIEDMVAAGSFRQQEIIDQSLLIASLNTEIASLKNSFSWRISAPLRKVKGIIRRGR